MANEIPSTLTERVGNLPLNEVAFSLFSPRQTKTKLQSEAVHKGAFGQMGHMLSIESPVPSTPFSRLYKTGKPLKYLTVKKRNKNKEKEGEQQIK